MQISIRNKYKNKEKEKGFTRSVRLADATLSRASGTSASSTAGFTLIELMIATALFVIVSVIALSAILSSNVAYKKTEDMRAITDNLTFALEDTSSNIKVGYRYSCTLGGDSDTLLDCPYVAVGGNSGDPPSPSMRFIPYTNIGAIVDPTAMQGYIVCEEEGFLSDGQTSAGSLYKIMSDVTGISDIASCDSLAISSNSNIVRLIDPRVRLDYIKSGFFVADTALDDDRQPYVTMILVGEIATKDITTPFTVQTTVTQRQFGK